MTEEARRTRTAFVKPRLIAGNWKMHLTATEAAAFVRAFRRALPPGVDADILLIPPFTALDAVRRARRDDDAFGLGAQDLHWEPEGAYTGAVSGPMLKDAGCRAVIIGHSERRRLFGDTDADVNRKLKAAVRHDLAPILCVGETPEERDAGRTEQVVGTQLRRGLHDVALDQLAGLTIAYEPVWAIGTGQAADVRQVEAVHASLRAMLTAEWGAVGGDARIIYGGSVSTHNARDFFGSPEINGALVGKTCLDPDGFATLCQFASSA